MQQKLTELLARRGFHLTKWISNDDKALESISKLERSNLGQFMLDNGVKEKVLGMQWQRLLYFRHSCQQKTFHKTRVAFHDSKCLRPHGIYSASNFRGKIIALRFVQTES